MPPLVQGVHGGTPLDAGLAVGALSIGWPVGSIIAGRAMLRFGVRPMVLAGTSFLVAGTVLLTQAVRIEPLWYAAAATVVTGLGMGLTSTPVLVAIQTDVSWRQRGQATGLVQFSRTIGGAIGTGILGALLAAGVGATASAILDPVARDAIPAAQLVADRAGLATGLGWIYVILAVAAAVAWLLAVRLIPAVHIGQSAESAESAESAASMDPRPAGPVTSGAAEAPRSMGEP